MKPRDTHAFAQECRRDTLSNRIDDANDLVAWSHVAASLCELTKSDMQIRSADPRGADFDANLVRPRRDPYFVFERERALVDRGRLMKSPGAHNAYEFIDAGSARPMGAKAGGVPPAA